MSESGKVKSCEQLEIAENVSNSDGELTDHEQEIEKSYVLSPSRCRILVNVPIM